MLHHDWMSDSTIRRLLTGGVAGLAVAALASAAYPAEVFRGYLVGFLFWLGISAGSLGILMVHHLTGGGWGRLIRRPLEAAAWTMPLLAVLFVPLLLAIRHVYVWAGAEPSMQDAVLREKAGYLNVPDFAIRAAVYFAIWIGLALHLGKWSHQQDRTRDPRLNVRLRRLSGPGLVAWALAYTFAAIDWVMSLQPHFFSTIFGVVVGMGQVLSAMAFAIVLVWLLGDRLPVKQVLHVRYVNDLAGLLLALVMFWAYVAFSQLLLIWAGNLPEETAWYLPRGFADDSGGWRWIAAALALLQFAVPFWLLLFPAVKRRLHRLAAVAGLILAMALVNLLWQVLPAFEPAGMAGHGMEIVAAGISWIGVGGVWAAAFLRQLRRVPLVALDDLAFLEAPRHV